MRRDAEDKLHSDAMVQWSEVSVVGIYSNELLGNDRRWSSGIDDVQNAGCWYFTAYLLTALFPVTQSKIILLLSRVKEPQRRARLRVTVHWRFSEYTECVRAVRQNLNRPIGAINNQFHKHTKKKFEHVSILARFCLCRANRCAAQLRRSRRDSPRSRGQRRVH